MKQSSSTHFGGIPIDTNTLAGQWMTFSHMANHYRKLLNVKPRVDTGLACGNPSNNSYNSYTMQSSKTGKKMGCLNTKPKKSTNASTCTSANNNSIYHNPRRDSLLYSSHPEHLNIVSGKTTKECKSPNKNCKSKQQKPQPQYHPQEYQVVFGPSSIRSSTDAFMSDDTDSLMSNDKPPSDEVAPIGVTEKIRRFLNHIHQLDLTTTKPKRVTTAPVTVANKFESPVTTPRKRSTQQSLSSVHTLVNSSSIDFRLSRHAKCFLPCEPKSPTKSNKALVTSPSKCVKGESAINFNNTSKPKVVVDQCSPCAHHFYSPRASRRSLAREEPHMFPEKDSGSKPLSKSRKRAGSIASIGTICGSDELTAEDFLVAAKHGSPILGKDFAHDPALRIGDNHSKSNKVIGSNTSSRKLVGKGSHHISSNRMSTGNLIKSNSVTSLLPSSSKGNPAPGVHGFNNNKDSSRDSAYGFSSGESRITTRESTPEKKSHQYAALGGDDPLIDFHDKPCKDSPPEDSHYCDLSSSKAKLKSSNEKHYRSSKSSRDRHHHHSNRSPLGSTAKSSLDLRRKDSSVCYITFLAEVTQDIVSKGIYTNRGLKALFKTHKDQNKDLNPDKLAEMMERLRMDLGIPKDDALDRMEFGYGSITNPGTTSFFYTPLQEKSTKQTPGGTSTILDDATKPIPSTSTSPPTIIHNVPTTATTTTTGFSSGHNTSSNHSTTEEGADIISVRSSDREDNEKNHEDDDFEDEELSLSDSEVTQALKFAGLDDGITEEVMGILKS